MVLLKKMGRAKMPITWIKSDASRHVTFTKRKKGLKKKVEELAILCGVEVCMICFNPQAPGTGVPPNGGSPLSSSTSSLNPSLKPGAARVSSASKNLHGTSSTATSNSTDHASCSAPPYSWGLPGVAHVISKYRSLSKEDQDKKKLDNTSLLEQQIKKLRSELKQKLEQNHSMETERAYFLWDERMLNGCGVDELRRLADDVLERTRDVYNHISLLMSASSSSVACVDRQDIINGTTMQAAQVWSADQVQQGSSADLLGQVVYNDFCNNNNNINANNGMGISQAGYDIGSCNNFGSNTCMSMMLHAADQAMHEQVDVSTATPAATAGAASRPNSASAYNASNFLHGVLADHASTMPAALTSASALSSGAQFMMNMHNLNAAGASQSPAASQYFQQLFSTVPGSNPQAAVDMNIMNQTGTTTHSMVTSYGLLPPGISSTTTNSNNNNMNLYQSFPGSSMMFNPMPNFNLQPFSTSTTASILDLDLNNINSCNVVDDQQQMSPKPNANVVVLPPKTSNTSCSTAKLASNIYVNDNPDPRFLASLGLASDILSAPFMSANSSSMPPPPPTGAVSSNVDGVDIVMDSGHADATLHDQVILIPFAAANDLNHGNRVDMKEQAIMSDIFPPPTMSKQLAACTSVAEVNNVDAAGRNLEGMLSMVQPPLMPSATSHLAAAPGVAALTKPVNLEGSLLSYIAEHNNNAENDSSLLCDMMWQQAVGLMPSDNYRDSNNNNNNNVENVDHSADHAPCIGNSAAAVVYNSSSYNSTSSNVNNEDNDNYSSSSHNSSSLHEAQLMCRPSMTRDAWKKAPDHHRQYAERAVDVIIHDQNHHNIAHDDDDDVDVIILDENHHHTIAHDDDDVDVDDDDDEADDDIDGDHDDDHTWRNKVVGECVQHELSLAEERLELTPEAIIYKGGNVLDHEQENHGLMPIMRMVNPRNGGDDELPDSKDSHVNVDELPDSKDSHVNVDNNGHTKYGTSTTAGYCNIVNDQGDNSRGAQLEYIDESVLDGKEQELQSSPRIASSMAWSTIATTTSCSIMDKKNNDGWSEAV